MTTRPDKIGSTALKVATNAFTVTEAGNGGFTALASVFGVKDSDNDIVVAGAFAESIAGRLMPSFYAHQMGDITACIGEMTAREVATGLEITVEFLDTEQAQHVRKLMQRGILKEFSWYGRITEGAWVETDEDWWYEIRKVDLIEAGPCFRGANPDTELLSLKSAANALTAKAGRVLAAKHVDTLKTIRDSLDGLIAAVDIVVDEIEEEIEDSAEEQKTLTLTPTQRAILALA